MKRKHARTTKLTASKRAPSELPTFLEHIYELRRRLFWVVAVIAVTSGVTYPFLGNIVSVLSAPLGGQQLYYLTPVGGISFSIKICMYVGILAAVPFLMYHLYKFLEPLMGNWSRSALYYVGLSTTFAVGGIIFAYYVSLPGALQFLTGLHLENIKAMLTVDSYLSFVMTYLLGAALLFQIPLLLLIINTMTPLKPGKLMKMQRYVIVGAFIIAAVISPTPDMLNQVLFALPIIAMYEIGAVLVWVQNRRKASKLRKTQGKLVVAEVTQTTPVLKPVVAPTVLARPVVRTQPAQIVPVQPAVAKIQPPTPPQKRPQYVDGMIMAPRQTQTVQRVRPAPQLAPQPAPVARRLQVPARSVDGFMPYRRSPAVGSS